MGSIHPNELYGQHRLRNFHTDDKQEALFDDDGFRLFSIPTDLLSGQNLTMPTCMRDDLLLLSWLIVLLRTQEGGSVQFDWAYQYRKNGLENKPANEFLSTNDVMEGLQDNLDKVAAAVKRHISATASSLQIDIHNPASIILSTGSRARSTKQPGDDGLLRFEVQLKNGYLAIRPVLANQNTPSRAVARFMESLADMFEICMLYPDKSVSDCLRPTDRDMDEIWAWNHQLPPTHSFCMHEMISERARRSPNKLAITSWDGDLTYFQVDHYSTLAACLLRDIGVQLHDVLPLCFEKSKWAAIAVLAAMKVGATFVLTDPTLPLARLQNMVKQVNAKMMVTSRNQLGLSASIMSDKRHVVVEADTFDNVPPPQASMTLAAVPPSALMYIIFTSGSTGTPKGVKISHETYTSSAIPRARAVGYTEESRVLDFASYAFDVSIDSMLLTLGNGGCLCIPSDDDRLNNINGVIRKMQVNYAGLTPSVARILEPDAITSLNGLGLGGEAVSARDVTIWGRDTRIIIGYGPCECTIGCTINSSAATGRDYISIGKGNGAAMWIVDPADYNSLMPVGAVGELLVEGPIVGQGYLNDPDKTAAAFINDPLWLTAGHNAYPGRRGRLYMTGDLGKYDPDGSGGIVFVGRKDTQVKLRGQRIELGEVESQLKARLPLETNIIAEIVTPQASSAQPMLVAFIALQPKKDIEHMDLKLVEFVSELRNLLSKANADLATVLPRYMIPAAYVPVNYIPVLISGKTDRKRLREFGAMLDMRRLDPVTELRTDRPLSDIEQRLRRAWAQVLNLDSESVRLGDNFFAMGGDSLSAMRLAAVCRTQGLHLTVASMFNHPTLVAMAGALSMCDVPEQVETLAFSMISQTIDIACKEAAHACGSSPEEIEDVYPCTPTQESLFTFSIKSNKPYVAQRVARIPAQMSLDSWTRAWEGVVAAIPILRTRIAQLQCAGLQQVVIKEGISWKYATSLAQYLEADQNERMELGQSLARYAIVSQSDGERYMVWTIHHVLYDGWSEPLILKNVSNILQGHQVQIQAQIKDFVKYVRDTDDAAMREFWKQELKGAVGPQFPHLPSRDYLPTADAILEHEINLEACTRSSFTMAALIRGAWALVASQYTGSDDVVFGETLVGRDVPLPGVESIIGPLIATAPVRIQIHRSKSVEAYLQAVQHGLLCRASYQHMGMQNIRKVSRDAQYACEAGTGLVIQPEQGYVGSELGFEEGDVVREALRFNPYPLMLACGVRKGGFKICANFDSSLVEVSQMRRILAQLEATCLQLASTSSKRVRDISCLPEEELNQIWQWGQAPPLSMECSSARLRADASVRQGSLYPRAAVPWVCNIYNPSLLSPIGCIGELWLEGNFLSGDVVESPAWLTAGSSSYPGRIGKTQPTGDIVQLREDGSLTFVGRKEDVVAVLGHTVDIVYLESHFLKHLPPTARAAIALLQSPPDNVRHEPESELVAFIEQHPSEEANVEVLPSSYQIGVQGSEMAIRSVISSSLVAALKRFDKQMQDSLPSYMVPYAYIVVDKLPTNTGQQVDRSLLSQLASRIPEHILTQLREGFKKSWQKVSTQTSLSATEDILRSSWAKILGIDSEQIDIDDNFFRLGGDSVLAMKLVSHLRAQGHGLTVADVFQHMRLGDAAKVLRTKPPSLKEAQPYRPFSTLASLDVERLLSEVIYPQLANSSWSVQDVLPVTESQAYDIKATIQGPRTSIQYNMLYFNDINQERLVQACRDLVKTHDILRTVFIEYESGFLQVVVRELDIAVALHQTDKDLEQYVNDLCTTRIESPFQLGSSFLEMLHVQGSSGQSCLVVGLSHAQYDGVSLPRLLRDLEALYAGHEITDSVPFSSYMAGTHSGEIRTRALSYWRDLLRDSSLSTLNGIFGLPTDKSTFHTKSTSLTQSVGDITIANLLTASWALLLARRLQATDVTFGSVTSGRGIELADVEHVMGPCYQITPVRVVFDPMWTTFDLLQFVQRQSAESAAHDFLGFKEISRQCTRWPSEAKSFGSIVHYQDFEDFDAMPFAGGRCQVDILNPHGDASHPLKAVAFLRGGQIHVGVVGSKRDSEFINVVLDELAEVVQELATSLHKRMVVNSKSQDYSLS